MSAIRTEYRAHVARMLTLAGFSDATAKPTRCSGSRRRSRRCTGPARTPGTDEGEQSTGAAPTSRGRRPGSTGPRSSPREAGRHPGARRLAGECDHRGFPPSSRASRSTLESAPRVSRHRAPRARPARGDRERGVRFLRPDADGAQVQRPALAAPRTPPAARSASRRADVRGAFFPASARREAAAMVAGSSRRWMRGSSGSTGWRRPPRRRRGPSSGPCA